ncbi:MAG: prepilin-type N-terminal cleavage/methylation domain-containing protein [Betaproteobacteria bacterium]
MHPPPPTRQHGFSLLEVLVAFVILALVATALSRLFGGSLANAGVAEEYSRALVVAESVLAETASAKPLQEGTKTGSADDGRIAWKTSVAAYDPPDTSTDVAAASATMPLRLYRVTVDVDFPGPANGRRVVALATTRIGAREKLQ